MAQNKRWAGQIFDFGGAGIPDVQQQVTPMRPQQADEHSIVKTVGIPDLQQPVDRGPEAPQQVVPVRDMPQEINAARPLAADSHSLVQTTRLPDPPADAMLSSLKTPADMSTVPTVRSVGLNAPKPDEKLMPYEINYTRKAGRIFA